MTDVVGTTIGSEENGEYRVVHRDGCVLIFGQVPLSDMGVLTKLAPKNAVVDFGLPALFGATFVFGLPDDLKSLKENAKPELLRKMRHRLGHTAETLTESEIQWLAYGDRGVSSETIFQLVRGVQLRAPNTLGVPRDPSDLRRCRWLIELSPYIADRFKEVLGVEPAWQALIESWDELCAIMDAEVPQWRQPECKQDCPKTMKKMYEIAAQEHRMPKKESKAQ